MPPAAMLGLLVLVAMWDNDARFAIAPPTTMLDLLVSMLLKSWDIHKIIWFYEPMYITYEVKNLKLIKLDKTGLISWV